MRWERAGLFAVAVLVVVATMGCSRGSGPPGWLYADSTGVLFLQWTDANGQLQGAAQFWQPPDRKTFSSTTATGSYSLTGVRNGDSVSLTVNAGLGITSTWNGQQSAEELTLQITQPNGTLQPLTFRRASVEDYNSAVSTQQQAAGARQQQADQQAAAQAQAQQQAADAKRRLDAANAANTKVTTDLDALGTATTAVLGISVQDRLDKYAQDWEKTQADFNAIPGIASCGSRQSKAGQVESDAGVIQSDDGAFESALTAANNTLDRADRALATLTADAETMTQAIADAGPDAPAPAVTPTVLDRATGNPRHAVDTARAALGQAKTIADGYRPKADKLAAQAVTVTSQCSDPPAPTSPTIPPQPEQAPQAPQPPVT